MLFKSDPDKYRAGLVAAYQGLFDELMQKGQIENTKSILANLEKIKGGLKDNPGKVRLALKQGDFSGAAADAVQCLLHEEHGSGENGPLLADALVLSFDTSEAVDKLPSPLRSDLGAVHAGIMNMSEGRYEEALAVMRPIGMRSLFSHWKIFVKGLGYDFEKVVERVSSIFQVDKNYITGRGRQKDRVRAKDLLCYWAAIELGIPMVDLARKFDMTPSAVSFAFQRANSEG